MATEDRESDPGIAAREVEAPRQTAAPQAVIYEPPPDVPLDELLWTEPYRFEFFAALRVLERIRALGANADEDEAALLEGLRFRALPSLSFPPSEIWDITRPSDPDRPVEMIVAFFGLTGPQGALPRPYTELLIERVRKKDYALRDFLDLFNHRLLQLFAAAGRKYRFYLTYERAIAIERRRRALGSQKLRGFLLEERPRIDLFSQVLLDLAGLGMPLSRYKDSLRSSPAPRLDISDDALRHYSGHFAQTHRSAASLRQLLVGYFQVRIEVVQFAGRWVQLPREYQTCLPASKTASATTPTHAGQMKSCSAPRLGENTVVGSRTWEAQGRFRVRLGPLTFEQFCGYLPDASGFRKMAQLVRLYVGATFDFDIQPTLSGPEVPWCQLRASGPAAARLGWNTWIRNRPFQDAVDDAVFRAPDYVSMGN